MRPEDIKRPDSDYESLTKIIADIRQIEIYETTGGINRMLYIGCFWGVIVASYDPRISFVSLIR